MLKTIRITNVVPETVDTTCPNGKATGKKSSK